jgi:L-2-hydroxyglutarate oxidase LhgO
VAAHRIAVVGAGIIGLAIARRLRELEPDAELTVLEKEAAVAQHQTAHNSGVVHAGVYYAPGSLKAILCRRGMSLLKDYCAQRGIEYQECGKLIVARDESELGRLAEIEARAKANGVPGLRRLERSSMAAVEPHVRGLSALHSPHTAIVDFQAVARVLASDLSDAGTQLRLGFEVAAISRSGREVRVRSSTGAELVVDRLIVCAGLHADRLARLAGETPAPWIVPFRGEYYRLVADCRDLVRGLIYPVPNPVYPFLGVHFTRRIDGHVDIGPNAVLALAREGYLRSDFAARDVWETLASQGFRRLARKHWRMGLRELHGSLSQRVFLAEAQRFIPSLDSRHVVRAPAGVRAQAVDADGSLLDDFRIVDHGHLVFIRNAPSPAATSSLAIAEYVVERLRNGGVGSRTQ